VSETLGPGQVRFRIHGPTADEGADTELVSARVFAAKIMALVRALQSASRMANRGKLLHDYKVARLHSSAPTVLLVEHAVPQRRPDIFFPHSGIPTFDDCITAVTSGDISHARQFGDCARFLSRLAKGSRKQFGYGEVWTRSDRVFRVDGFLEERADAVERGPTAVGDIPRAGETKWYIGVAIGSFDGTVRAVDLRGALPEIKLVLTAGSRQIDCVCRVEQIETIRTALNRRVRLEGRAIYDGRSGLPRRIEVSHISDPVGITDFTRWRGTFKPFEIEPWETGDERGDQ